MIKMEKKQSKKMLKTFIFGRVFLFSAKQITQEKQMSDKKSIADSYCSELAP